MFSGSEKSHELDKSLANEAGMSDHISHVGDYEAHGAGHGDHAHLKSRHLMMIALGGNNSLFNSLLMQSGVLNVVNRLHWYGIPCWHRANLGQRRSSIDVCCIRRHLFIRLGLFYSSFRNGRVHPVTGRVNRSLYHAVSVQVIWFCHGLELLVRVCYSGSFRGYRSGVGYPILESARPRRRVHYNSPRYHHWFELYACGEFGRGRIRIFHPQARSIGWVDYSFDNPRRWRRTVRGTHRIQILA